MKFKILEVVEKENYSVEVKVEIKEDDGTLVFSGTMNLFTTAGTKELAEAEIKQSIYNKYMQIKNERNAKLSETATSLINTEIKV